MVERSLSMREVPGSIPGASILFFLHHLCFNICQTQENCSHSRQEHFGGLEKKKIIKGCIVRESNPGRPRGRRAFYH